MSIYEKSKTAREIFKGAANHWRIAIICAVHDYEDITVEGLAKCLEGDFKNISQHTRRLVQAGLLQKLYRGRQVVDALSPYGRAFFRFMKTV